jgi:hypothetical protein
VFDGAEEQLFSETFVLINHNTRYGILKKLVQRNFNFVSAYIQLFGAGVV